MGNSHACMLGIIKLDRRDLIIARDAGNGLPLWKAKIKTGKEFDWEYAVKVAALIASRGERVYALTEDGKLKALDAATGRPIEVSEEAATPFDIIVADDWRERVVVIDRRTKAIIWQYGVTDRKGHGPGYLNYPDGFDIDVFRDWKAALA